jgi:DNA-binding transcriptional LysR family regulator
VSKQVLALEKELGVQLFDRSKRAVQLTEGGEVFLEHAEALLGDFNRMNDALDDVRSQGRLTLKIGSIPVMAQYGIAAMITGFKRSHPAIQMSVDEREASDLLPALERGDYELIFLRGDHLNDSRRHQTFALYRDRLVAVLPRSHPLSGEAAISLPALSGEDFLLLEKRTDLYDLCVGACKKAGFSPNVVYSGTRIENILEMVGQGMGVSLLMEVPARYAAPRGVAILPLREDVSSHITLARLRRQRLSVASEAFWSYVKEQSAHSEC